MSRVDRLFAKDLVRGALSVRLLTSHPTRHIFAYHDVSDSSAPQHSPLYSTPPQTFREQIEFLSSEFNLVPLSTLLDSEQKPRGRSASITFDDGFRSVLQVVEPLLAAKRIPFAVFVNGAAVKENRLSYAAEFDELNRSYGGRAFLNEEDLRLLARRGVTIGSHAWSHAVLSRLPPNQAKEEIGKNKRFLEGLLGHPVPFFAVPYGKREHYTGSIIDACLAAGHTHVFTTNPRGFRPGVLASGRPVVPRIPVRAESVRELTFLVNRPLVRQVEL